MIRLDVYVIDGCWSCEESVRIASEMQAQYPEVAVAVINAGIEEVPQEVFATPTWMLDGRVISLGNPTRENLHEKLNRIRAKA